MTDNNIILSSHNEWSCGLACLGSLAASQGRPFDQAAFIEEHRHRFPQWATMPGVLALKISVLGRIWMLRWELYDIARELGWANNLSMPRDPQALAQALAEPGGCVIAVTKRSVENGVDLPQNHAVRVLASDSHGVSVMNPGRHEPGRIEALSWAEFLRWEPFVFGLSKKGAGPGEAEPSFEGGAFKTE